MRPKLLNQMINLPPFPNNTTPDWSGFTLQEIRMRRALVQARMEIQKFKMNAAAETCKNKMPLFGNSSDSLLGRVAGAFSIVDYGIFAFKAVRWIISHRKK